METKTIQGYVSADGHVTEPADLWTTRLDKRFRERGPRIDSRPDGDYIAIDNLPPWPVGSEGAMINDKTSGQIKSVGGYRYGANRAGAVEPRARLADQSLDNLRAEVIYPNVIGFLLFGIEDAELQRASIQVFNDWVCEFGAVVPDRLLLVGILPSAGPIEWAIEEARRIAKKGLRSVLLPAEPDRSYFVQAAHWEPLWPVLQDLNLVVAFHVATGGRSFMRRFERIGIVPGVVKNKMMTFMPAAETICAGVTQRYPRLRFVLAEASIGQLAYALHFMDHWWEAHHHWMDMPEPPSAYFHRQFWATFETDRAGLLTRELLNLDHLMWGSDYPHTEGTFPRSREQIAKDFPGIPEAEVYKIVVDNAAQLYGLK
jgi:predicted TIM-barrel fold metal-dependent hydrolase